jgi:hypothetical protein
MTLHEIHNLFAPARRMVPPPLVGWGLIVHAQSLRHGEDRCFTCGRKAPLVEDHCHETGQVRACLCRSCNTLEGFGSDPVWHDYRAKAPGVGLHVFYTGRGWERIKWPEPPRVEWPCTISNYVERAVEFLEWARSQPSLLPGLNPP